MQAATANTMPLMPTALRAAMTLPASAPVAPESSPPMTGTRLRARPCNVLAGSVSCAAATRPSSASSAPKPPSIRPSVQAAPRRMSLNSLSSRKPSDRLPATATAAASPHSGRPTPSNACSIRSAHSAESGATVAEAALEPVSASAAASTGASASATRLSSSRVLFTTPTARP